MSGKFLVSHVLLGRVVLLPKLLNSKPNFLFKKLISSNINKSNFAKMSSKYTTVVKGAPNTTDYRVFIRKKNYITFIQSFIMTFLLICQYRNGFSDNDL